MLFRLYTMLHPFSALSPPMNPKRSCVVLLHNLRVEAVAVAWERLQRCPGRLLG